MNVLVVAAHPDDEILGCGGTMARLSKEGHDVHVAILGEGITSRYEKRDRADVKLVDDLRADSREAARIVGAKKLHLFGLPDNRFDSWDILDVVKVIEGVIEETRPQVVYTQHGGDLNVDHVAVFRATLTATRPVPGSAVRAVYAYPVGSSSEWAFQKFSPRFSPTVFVDVSATLETKVAAMEAYRSEARPFPHPRSAEAIRATAQHWGSCAGLHAAEPFELVREVR